MSNRPNRQQRRNDDRRALIVQSNKRQSKAASIRRDARMTSKQDAMEINRMKLRNKLGIPDELARLGNNSTSTFLGRFVPASQQDIVWPTIILGICLGFLCVMYLALRPAAIRWLQSINPRNSTLTTWLWERRHHVLSFVTGVEKRQDASI
jgi:hypothetical protein